MKASNLEQIDIDRLDQSPLSSYTTFQLGGSSKGILHVQTPEQLISVVNYLKEHQLPFILIGGGSNLVVSDEGVNCYVIRYLSDEPLIEQDDLSLKVSGSTKLDDLVAYAQNKGMKGINFASGIPGAIGGAVIGNAGAFGKQIGDILKSATLLSFDGSTRVVCNEECEFVYRHSILKETGEIVVSVCLSFQEGDIQELTNERAEILKLRASKHPHLSTHPCAGSFFRNVEPTSKAGKRQAAGWFLEQAGGKSLAQGGALIFDRHANIIVKGEKCTAVDVLNLSEQMRQIVKGEFSIDLVREVRFVGQIGEKRSKDIIW